MRKTTDAGAGASTSATANTSASGLLAIIKKEFKRFFSDRRMVISTILLPGLMIYVIYSFIGTGLGSMFSVPDDYQPTINAVNLPKSIEAIANQADIAITAAQPDQVDAIKTEITDKTQDLLIVFPEDFDQVIASIGPAINAGTTDGDTPTDANTPAEANTSAYSNTPSTPNDPTTSPSVPALVAGPIYTPPNVELFYNSARTESQASFIQISGLINAYKDAQFTLFSVNAPDIADPDASYDLATSKDTTGQVFGLMLPMLMMIFLFSGAMAVAPESISGEKERGTIATLLVTPLKRWELALGKVISLSFIAILAGASSFIGVMLSMPKMMGEMSDQASAALYSPVDYLMLFVIIISTVLLFIGLISLISAFAKTIKEASTLVMPLMIVVMLIGILGMFGNAQTDPLFYLIPAYNSVQCMVGIFAFDYQPLFVALTVVVNLVIVGVCIFALTKMFNSEKIVFTR